MLEDGELSSLFSQGKGPAAGRPPKPLNEVNIPKLVTKAIAKPQIKTGVLKPTKQKVSKITKVESVDKVWLQIKPFPRSEDFISEMWLDFEFHFEVFAEVLSPMFVAISTYS